MPPPNGSAPSWQGDLFPPEPWTNEASPLCGPAISPATTSAISSSASAVGPMRSSLPAGAAPSGPAPVPVSRFRAQDSGVAMPINDTSGPLFTASSPSAALQLFLESRLRVALDVNGSPEYALIWRQQDMPSGPPICALRASPRRTSGRDYSGWRTPQKMDGERGPAMNADAKAGQHSLTTEAQLAGWPTPNATMVDETLEHWSERRERVQSTPRRTGVHAGKTAGRDLHLKLEIAAQLAGWPTPDTMTGPHGPRGVSTNPAHQSANGLEAVARAAGWPTPQSADAWVPEKITQNTLHRGHWNSATRSTTGSLAKDAPWKIPASGTTPSGSPASTAKRGALNPAFSRWLMGYPPEWDDCAVTAMPSSRRSRQSS
jgi:hypothetical protein